MNQNEPYAREAQHLYLVKDMKNSDIHAKLFSPKYLPNEDIKLSKADLVFDSFILSDFSLISGPGLSDTAQL